MGPGNLLFVLAAAAAAAPFLIAAQRTDFPTANLSSLWTNNASLPNSGSYPDGSFVRAIVISYPRTFDGPSFAAGFFYLYPRDVFLFGVFIGMPTNNTTMIAKVVWSTNRARPVKENATLELTSEGNLVLRDADSSLVWSSTTSGRSVAGMVITERGNLVLFDNKNATVWQSFDHPTDALVPGQSLMEGMSLVANTNESNWTESQFYLTVLPNGLYAYVRSEPPQLYFSESAGIKNKTTNDPTQVTLTDSSLNIFMNPKQQKDPDSSIYLPVAKSRQYMRLEFDGHLRLYQWYNEQGWTVVYDITKRNLLDDCDFPTVCGEYGICTNNGQCSSPSLSYFKPIDERMPNLGYTPQTPISCREMQHHQLLKLENVTYFDVSHTIVSATNAYDCKRACLNNCSCKAVIFRYGQNDSNGNCFWVTKVFSLQLTKPEKTFRNSSAYLKVQPIFNGSKKKVVIIATAATLAAILVLVTFAVILCLPRKKKHDEFDDELDFDQLSGMTVRFSFENLRECTQGFSIKLGEGGFGTVFEGKLGEEKVAVKRLECARQGKKEFLAEVETIGSIEHINLVRLIGFCSEKSQRLLVYEYMSGGSLDRWIYYRHNNAPLDWCTRYRIILDVAKGLSYLHELCRRKIVHLDIKPQNILLDENFNAKVADFGLSKLIDRDQSKVMTVMRGTPGYLAPEWLTSQITEKVDVYSFGVVVMEVISGRKNIDNSLSEESVQLVNILREKARNNQLIDMIDKHSDDMALHPEEAIDLMKLAMWCLQNDSNKRPSMSLVVKVLEGSVEIQTDIDCSFVNENSVVPVQHNQSPYSSPPQASILSGPR